MLVGRDTVGQLFHLNYFSSRIEVTGPDGLGRRSFPAKRWEAFRRMNDWDLEESYPVPWMYR